MSQLQHVEASSFATRGKNATSTVSHSSQCLGSEDRWGSEDEVPSKAWPVESALRLGVVVGDGDATLASRDLAFWMAPTLCRFAI